MIRLRTVRFSRSNEGAVGIIGGGNSAHALAAYLAQRGYAPHLFVRAPEKVPELARAKLLRATGAIEGLFAVPMVTGSMEELLAACSTVFICTVATAYRDVARQMAPYLTDTHEVVVFSSKLFGSLQLSRAIDAHHGVQPDLIAETDALFAARLQSDGSVHVRGIKKWNLAATPAPQDMQRGVELVQRFFPQVERAASLVQRGLTDFGALVHPLTVLVNANRVDRGESFLFYMDGFTPRTAALIETLESEFRGIAAAYGSSLISARELLDRYYGCDTSGTLLHAMRTVPNYQTSIAPTQLDHRYLREDVTCTLLPAHQLAKKAKVDVPVLDSIVALARVLLGSALFTDCRDLASLGLADLSAAEISERLQMPGPRSREQESPRYELVS